MPSKRVKTKKITVEELARYCAQHPPARIVYDAENQHYSPDVIYACKFRLFFNKILVCENPNQVSLLSAGGSILFDGVRAADLDERFPDFGVLLTLLCSPNGKDMETHTLLLS